MCSPFFFSVECDRRMCKLGFWWDPFFSDYIGQLGKDMSSVR